MDDYLPYSKRRRQAGRAGKPLVYKFDEIPRAFRVQAGFCLMEAIGVFDVQAADLAGALGHGYHPPQNRLWNLIVFSIMKELGLTSLVAGAANSEQEFIRYVQNEEDPERVIDALEIGFRYTSRDQVSSGQVENAISELNRRFWSMTLGTSL